MPSKPRRPAALTVSPATSSSKQTESLRHSVEVDRSSPGISDSREGNDRKSSSIGVVKPIVGFSAFKSAFDVSSHTSAPFKKPQSSKQESGSELRSNTKPVPLKQKSCSDDVIVLDDSDIEEEEDPVSKRPRLSTHNRKVSALTLSSDEQYEEQSEKKSVLTSGKKRVTQVIAPGLHDSEETDAMWCEAYSPTSVADLATSKNRIHSVQVWLEEALFGRPRAVDSDIPFSEQAKDRIRKYRRILVLSGPAGVAKTTTLKVIAKELGAEVVEWEEGTEDWGISGQMERESLSSKLVGFLSRNAYQPLSLATPSSTSMSSQKEMPASSAKAPSKAAIPPRILLFTSLPNLSHPPTRQIFHQALIDYTKAYSTTSCPLVLVVADAGSSGAAEESWSSTERGSEAVWDLRAVLGKDLITNPAVGIVEFLPMAPTFLIKALKRISAFAFPDVKSRPSQEVIQLIAHSANGDLRSAINSLQFLSRSGNSRNIITSDANASTSGKKTGKGSRGGKGAKLKGSDEVKSLLNAIARREQSLGLFHALGKIMYNKRLGDTDDKGLADQAILDREEHYQKAHPLPSHLSQYVRRRYENDIDSLIASVPVDTASFMLWIHQNLPQFCSQIEEVSQAFDYICEADLTRAEDDLWQRSPHAIAYAFHISVRGSLSALPHPVPKANQKLVKPQFFDHLKALRENAGSISEAAKWLSAKCIKQQDIRNETHDQNAVYGGWGGQLSRKVIATEFMPGLRLLKKDVPSSIVPEDRASFVLQEPHELRLEILDERENVPQDDLGEGDLDDMAFTNETRSQAFATKGSGWEDEEDQNTQVYTWLEEDDIQEM